MSTPMTTRGGYPSSTTPVTALAPPPSGPAPGALRPRTLLMDHFRTLLSLASEERALRPDVVGVWPDCDLGWVLFERQTMFDEVNRLRAEVRADPVELGAVRRVETSAAGHTDYAARYALGCADLTLDGQGADEQQRIARSR